MPRSRATRLTVVPVLAAVLAGALAGCGGPDEPAPRVTVTVTVTPTRTPDIRAAEPTGRGIAGRRHDVGTIVGTDQRDGRLVLLLDRWTVRGVPDDDLAEDGVPLVPEDGDRFVNNTDDKYYEVPVGPGVQVVVTRCVPSEKPGMMPGTRSVPTTMGDFLSRKNRKDELVLLGYTTGLLVTLETSPRCPKGSIPRAPRPAPSPTAAATSPAAPTAAPPTPAVRH